MNAKHTIRGGLAAALAISSLGCAASRLDVRPVRYTVDLTISPAENLLAAHASVELETLDAVADDAPAAVELKLHPALTVESVSLTGATLRSHEQDTGSVGDDEEVVPTVHRLVVERASDRMRVELGYRGELSQDVASGEREGAIHNFAVSAHVGREGLYLEPSGFWYPRIEFPDEADPALGLADYRLSVAPIEGFELVAGLEREAPSADGVLRWSSPFPLDGMVLLGGPLQRFGRRHGDIELHAVLAPGKESVAEDILDASAEYLDRYQRLIGPYPFREFTVLEAFFSSGFAFPTCTQIVGSQLSEYKQYRRHGYLDHELLHNWWGNGLFVDPRDGNWCEGLASYMGNYYGHVLDGDAEGARKQRRNQSNFLSAIEEDDDLPLGTFGLDDGAKGGIGYQKGAAVFHMLERRIGEEAMFAGLRRLTAERMGRYTSWEQLTQVFEAESGEELETFFDQWVRRTGAPLLELREARRQPGSSTLSVTLSQEPTDFTLDVPLRLHYGARFEDVVVRIDEPVETVELTCETGGLTAVELDPDYHVFRKLKPEETMPTSGLTRRSERLVIVVPEGELDEGYQVVVDSFTRAVLGDDDEPEEGHEVVVRRAGELRSDELLDAGVLVVGAAVRHPLVEEFVGSTRSPVSWSDAGFTVEGETYSEAREAVFFTVHHPRRPEHGVTVYYGNSAAALSNARVLNYYPNSLLVFETPEDEEGVGSGMPRARVVRRIDFEFHDRVEF